MSSAASASLPPSRPNLPSLELATGLGPIHPARLYSVLHATKRFQGLGFLFCHSNQFRELEAASGLSSRSWQSPPHLAISSKVPRSFIRRRPIRKPSS